MRSYKALVASVVLAGAAGAHALTFNITSTGNAQADAGFAQAAAMWSSQFLDPITVNVTALFSNLGDPNVIGQAGSTRNPYTYTSVRDALIADHALHPQNDTDARMIANLPGGSTISFNRNRVDTGAVVFDNDGSNNNSFLSVNRANAKALGLLAANAAGEDTEITFNSIFAFDFDRTPGVTAADPDGNGIDNDKVDFIGVAFHELGHALGFTSGVDTYDRVRSIGPSASNDAALNNGAIFSVLDLTRFNSASGNTVRDFRYGGTANFSIDGGANPESLFSTGYYNGDGNQASHWKDDMGLGALDPTGAFGELIVFSERDGTAIDAIGYDVVPEPGTMLALAGGLAALAARRRRRASK